MKYRVTVEQLLHRTFYVEAGSVYDAGESAVRDQQRLVYNGGEPSLESDGWDFDDDKAKVTFVREDWDDAE